MFPHAEAQHGASSITSASSLSESEGSEEQEQAIIARLLASLHPEESKKSRQSGLTGSTCNSTGSILQASSLYPLHYETWGYSGSSTDIEMYRMWQQAQFHQMQGLVSPLAALPTPLPNVHALPYMHSILQPNQLYFLPSGQARIPVGPAVMFTAPRPSFHSSNQSIPAPNRVRSMVTIQEIQDDSEGSSTFCPFRVSKSPEPSGNKKEAIKQGKGQEDDKQKLGNTYAKPEDAGHPSRQVTRFSDCTSIDSGYRDTEFKLKNTREHSPSELGPHIPRRASLREVSEPAFPTASPIRVRATSPAPFTEQPRPSNFSHQTAVRRPGVRPYAARPRVEFGPPHFIAPAVQIRSVVPVCSAPPARKMTTSTQEGQSSDSEKKSATGQEGMLSVSSELSKLQI